MSVDNRAGVRTDSLDTVPIADYPIRRGTPTGMEWQVPGEKMADGSLHRPEFKRFELKNRVQIPHLREAWAHPGHICTGTRWGLLGVVRAAVGADRIHRGPSGASAANGSTGTLPLSACANSSAPSVRGIVSHTAYHTAARNRIPRGIVSRTA